MLTCMLPGDWLDVPGEDDDHHDLTDDITGRATHDEAPPSPWSQRMPSSVAGLAGGAVVCLVVIAACVAAIAWALKLLVHT